jgi:hypothetical protein
MTEPTRQTVKWVKVTNKDEKHRNFQYHDGLNVLKEDFNNDKQASCVKGGLYFTTLEHVHKFYGYGCWLRIVELPVNDPELGVVQDLDGDKWRANKLIFMKRYSLEDPDTYIRFRISIPSDLFETFARENNVKMLQKWKESKLEMKYIDKVMDVASRHGSIDVLKWWKQNDMRMTYTKDAMDHACEYDRLEVIAWWKNSGLPIKYSNWSSLYLMRNDRKTILDWLHTFSKT